MHDDQHGTAVVILAALMNAAAVVGKRVEDLTVVLTGSGAAGTATIKMLLAAGVPTELHILAGAPHAFDSMMPDTHPAKPVPRRSESSS